MKITFQKQEANMSDYRRGIIISLCDLTGTMVKPWVENGYDAILVDPQHPASAPVEMYPSGGSITRVSATIIETLDRLGAAIRSGRVVFVAGFPPCTDVSLSGTRWWAEKMEKDRYFQAKAAMVAEQCRMVGALSGAPWFFENPKSAFSMMFGSPNHKFQPFEYTAWCPEDHYRKETWLWSGNGFVMPPAMLDAALSGRQPDERIHKAPPGEGRANFRSATPLGFARAVFAANAPHLRALSISA
jgi:hypothetical protein